MMKQKRRTLSLEPLERRMLLSADDNTPPEIRGPLTNQGYLLYDDSVEKRGHERYGHNRISELVDEGLEDDGLGFDLGSIMVIVSPSAQIDKKGQVALDRGGNKIDYASFRADFDVANAAFASQAGISVVVDDDKLSVNIKNPKIEFPIEDVRVNPAEARDLFSADRNNTQKNTVHVYYSHLGNTFSVTPSRALGNNIDHGIVIAADFNKKNDHRREQANALAHELTHFLLESPASAAAGERYSPTKGPPKSGHYPNDWRESIIVDETKARLSIRATEGKDKLPYGLPTKDGGSLTTSAPSKIGLPLGEIGGESVIWGNKYEVFLDRTIGQRDIQDKGTSEDKTKELRFAIQESAFITINDTEKDQGGNIIPRKGHGNRVDFNWVEDSIQLNATKNDHSPRKAGGNLFDWMSWKIAKAGENVSSPGMHARTEDVWMKQDEDFARLPQPGAEMFADETFDVIDVVSMITRYTDMDVGGNRKWSPKAAALDYEIEVLNFGTRKWVKLGDPDEIFDKGWTTKSTADDYLARWKLDFDASEVRIRAKKYKSRSSDNSLHDGNTQIDAIIVGKREDNVGLNAGDGQYITSIDGGEGGGGDTLDTDGYDVSPTHSDSTTTPPDTKPVYWVMGENADVGINQIQFYSVSEDDGAVLATFKFDGAPAANAYDLKDLVVGPGPDAAKTYLYFADTGDGGFDFTRSEPTLPARILRVEEPAEDEDPTPDPVSFTTFTLTYPESIGYTLTPAMLIDPIANADGENELYLFGYGIVASEAEALQYGTSLVSRVMLAEGATTATTDQAIELQLMATVPGWVASADISPDGRFILILLSDGNKNSAYVYHRLPGETVAEALTREPQEISTGIENPEYASSIASDQQGEGFYIVSKTSATSSSRVTHYEIPPNMFSVDFVDTSSGGGLQFNYELPEEGGRAFWVSLYSSIDGTTYGTDDLLKSTQITGSDITAGPHAVDLQLTYQRSYDYTLIAAIGGTSYVIEDVVLTRGSDIEVFGTSGDDVIEVVENGTNLEIRIDGVMRGSYATASVSEIFIRAGSGDDQITVDPQLPAALTAWLFGGAGDDILLGGLGDDKLYGGLGNDQIEGGAVNASKLAYATRRKILRKWEVLGLLAS